MAPMLLPIPLELRNQSYHCLLADGFILQTPRLARLCVHEEGCIDLDNEENRKVRWKLSLGYPLDSQISIKVRQLDNAQYFP